MNEVTLPASPNWYLSKVLVSSQNGTIAWGARNNIVIARHNEDNISLQYSMISNAHTDRVNCLAFSPAFGQPNKNLLISSGNEHICTVWDLDNLSAIKAYAYPETKQIVAAVDWSSNPDKAYIVSTDGCLISWNLLFDTNTQIQLKKVTATCLSCCPHNRDLVAIGTKSGLVFIVNVAANTKGTVMYKLRGHDVEIVSLSWCPVDTNVITSTGKRDLLLASGGKDRSVFIWSAGGDGRYEAEITLPQLPLDSQHHRTKLNSAIGNWTAVCWLRPTLLLATSSWGELISCELSSFYPTKNKPTWKLIHGEHRRGLFSISQVPKNAENSIENWREDIVDTIWTTGQDRQVICCKLTGQNIQIDYNIPTQGGFIYCIAACPLETSLIAFGVGDAMLRLWNLSEPHETLFAITTLWQKIQGQVRTVSWHPKKENILAYATGDGRVGVVDTNEKKSPTLLRQYHRNTVYNLGWGKNPHDENYALFSCAEGELVFYTLDRRNGVPTNVFEEECTSFAWKPDLSCLAVGFENGSILFLDKDLVTRHGLVHPVKQDILCLSWHPDSTATDLSLSPLQNYLAVSANTTAIIIFDLSELIKSLDNSENPVQENETTDKNTVTLKTPKVVATLSGHTEKVVCLAWSPHFSGHLISGSYDGTAQVWNVETQQLMGTFTGHSGAVLSCIWSPLNPDLIMTGGTDFTLHVWKLSEQSPIIPKEKSAARKSRSKKNKVKAPKSLLTVSNTAVHKSSLITEEKATLSNGTINETKLPVDAETRQEVIDKLPSKESHSSNDSTSEIEKTAILNSIRNLIRSTQIEGANVENIEKKDETPSLFSNSEDFSAFLSHRKSDYAAKNMDDMVTEIEIWCGDLKKNLQEAAKQKRLNDVLVSLAPSLSMKTWIEMCDAYAIQLVSEGNPRKAVSYLLCVHKIPQAIEVLINANMYKEAYTLARCKLDPDDKLIKTVLCNWAIHSSVRNFEQAALCYAKLGAFSNAAKMVARRNDTQYFEIAAELASLSEDSNLCEYFAERAIFKALTDFDCSKARGVIDKIPQMQYRTVRIGVFEEIQKAIKKEDKLNTVPQWVQGKSNYGLFQTLSGTFNNCHLYYNDALQKNIICNPENEAKLWINVSDNIALALMTNEEQKRLQHIVSALDSISQFEIKHVKPAGNRGRYLIDVLTHLDMNSPKDNNSIYAKKDLAGYKSLRAYLCMGLLNWLVHHLKHSTIESEDIRPIVELVQTLLEDVLDPQTVEFWSMTKEINKLETKIASTLGPSSNTDNDGNAKEDMMILLRQLDEIKNTIKLFIQERISAPCPIVAYSVANELIDIIPDEAMKAEFTKVLTEKFTSAISKIK